MWPDFGAEDLQRVVREFAERERRFGGLAATAEEEFAVGEN
jgi:hypothetical protein